MCISEATSNQPKRRQEHERLAALNDRPGIFVLCIPTDLLAVSKVGASHVTVLLFRFIINIDNTNNPITSYFATHHVGRQSRKQVLPFILNVQKQAIQYLMNSFFHQKFRKTLDLANQKNIMKLRPGGARMMFLTIMAGANHQSKGSFDDSGWRFPAQFVRPICK